MKLEYGYAFIRYPSCGAQRRARAAMRKERIQVKRGSGVTNIAKLLPDRARTLDVSLAGDDIDLSEFLGSSLVLCILYHSPITGRLGPPWRCEGNNGRV